MPAGQKPYPKKVPAGIMEQLDALSRADTARRMSNVANPWKDKVLSTQEDFDRLNDHLSSLPAEQRQSFLASNNISMGDGFEPQDESFGSKAKGMLGSLRDDFASSGHGLMSYIKDGDFNLKRDAKTALSSMSTNAGALVDVAQGLIGQHPTLKKLPESVREASGLTFDDGMTQRGANLVPMPKDAHSGLRAMTDFWSDPLAFAPEAKYAGKTAMKVLDNPKGYFEKMALQLGEDLSGNSRSQIFRNATDEEIAQAQKLMDAGGTPDSVWNEMKVALNTPDGIPRYEIDDSQMVTPQPRVNALSEKIDALRKGNNGNIPDADMPVVRQEWDDLQKFPWFKADNKGNNAKLSKTVNHPELFRLFPEAKDIKTKYDAKLRGGSLSSSEWIDKVIPPDGAGFGARHGWKLNIGTGDGRRSPDMSPEHITAHELQHVVQRLQGGLTGASADRLKSVTSQLQQMGIDPATATKAQMYEAYHRTAGEVEARLAQNRLRLTDAERRAQYPYEPDYFKQMTGVAPSEILNPRTQEMLGGIKDINTRVAEADTMESLLKSYKAKAKSRKVKSGEVSTASDASHIGWHASPHQWANPAIAENIGKGHGADAIGRGLYQAETPEYVKKFYAHKFMQDKHWEGSDTPHSFVYKIDNRWGDPAKEAKTPLTLDDYIDFNGGFDAQSPQVIDALRAVDDKTVKKHLNDWYKSKNRLVGNQHEIEGVNFYRGLQDIMGDSSIVQMLNDAGIAGQKAYDRPSGEMISVAVGDGNVIPVKREIYGKPEGSMQVREYNDTNRMLAERGRSTPVSFNYEKELAKLARLYGVKR